MTNFTVTASALKIRSLPRVSEDTDTGARLIRGQVVEVWGKDLNNEWAWLVGPSGTGWSSLDFLSPVEVKIPTPRWTPRPHGLVDLRNTFGDPTPFIQRDGTISSEWARRVQEGRVQLPLPLPLAWNRQQNATTIACHPLIVDPLRSVFNQIHSRGFWNLLEDYGGCYNWRNARGLSKLSTHCWAISVDLNPNSNPLGAKPKMPKQIVGIFEDHGFIWGGEWSRPDGMHFQYVSGY